MSETTTLKLKKHDNPSTNEEQFDVENYLNGNWDKIDENVGEVNTNISNINSKNTELEKELKEAQEDFYQNSIRGQASGEYIHVEDSSNCRAKIGIGGNQEQETRSGKNLLELMEGTYSDQGITAVVKNGIVTLNGAATGISFVGINLLKSIELTSDKTYHLSAFNEKTAGDGTNYCSLRLNQDNIQVLFNTANVNGSITTNLKVSFITIRTAQGITYNNFVVKPQLELGAGTKEWEQGGVSPSPDYQSEVKSVGSNVNLFDKDTHTLVNSSETRVQTDYILLKKGTYTLNFIGADSFYLMIFNENKVKVKETDWTEKNSSFELDNKYYIAITFRKNNNIALNKDEVVNIKLVEGTEAGGYSEYGQGCINEVICNDNLFNKDKAINGAFILADTGELSYNSNWNISEYIPVIAGKKYIVYGVVSTTAAFYDKNKKFIKTQSITMNNIIVATEEIKYIKIDVKNDYLNTAVIIEGTEEKGYIEHKSQTYTIPTQQEMLEGDYFDWDNEEEVHTWGKYEFTGEEAFSIAFNSNYYVIYTQGDFINNFDYNETVETYKCSHFKSIAVNTRYQNNTFFINTTRNLIFTTLKYSTVTDFKTWLKSLYDAGTPVVVYYKLAIPTRLQFTEEQKALAKELNNARTYKNVTNITTDSKAILSLDYAKDLETLLNNTQALAVNNASEGV